MVEATPGAHKTIEDVMQAVLSSAYQPPEGVISSYFARSDINTIRSYFGVADTELRAIFALHETTVGMCKINSRELIRVIPDLNGTLIVAHRGLNHFNDAINAHFAAMFQTEDGVYIASPANYLNPWDLRFPEDDSGKKINRLTHIWYGATVEDAINDLKNVEGGDWELY